MPGQFHSWLRALLPRACPGCGQQLGAHAGLCPACQAQLHAHLDTHSPLRARPEAHLITLGTYHGVRRRAIRALKFGGARELAAVLGQALATGVPAGWGITAVVPVPLHGTRQRQRGFNQAELLGRALAAHLGVPCLNTLTRTRATRQQSKQHAAQRDDMQGAFQADPRHLPPGPVLLVDDVLTTGATLLACQAALHAAGVQQIYVAVIAR